MVSVIQRVQRSSVILAEFWLWELGRGRYGLAKQIAKGLPRLFGSFILRCLSGESIILLFALKRRA